MEIFERYVREVTHHLPRNHRKGRSTKEILKRMRALGVSSHETAVCTGISMESTPDAVELMRSAWATRRRFLSAAETEQEALIQEAHRKLVEAVAICRNDGPLPQLAQAIHLLANVEHDMGREHAAQELWEEAVSICRAAGDNLQLAHKVRHLGDLHHHLGRLDQAERCYEEALTLYRSHDDPPSLDFANAVSRMATLKEATRLTEEAIRLWREARDLYEAAEVAAGVEECSKRVTRLEGTGIVND